MSLVHCHKVLDRYKTFGFDAFTLLEMIVIGFYLGCVTRWSCWFLQALGEIICLQLQNWKCKNFHFRDIHCLSWNLTPGTSLTHLWKPGKFQQLTTTWLPHGATCHQLLPLLLGPPLPSPQVTYDSYHEAPKHCRYQHPLYQIPKKCKKQNDTQLMP